MATPRLGLVVEDNLLNFHYYTGLILLGLIGNTSVLLAADIIDLILVI